MNRKWSVYELNQLIKYGFSTDDLSKYGEKPVEYITGHAQFDGLDFLVNANVLIPRVETVQMVEVADGLLSSKTDVYFAEIGTGCGAIGIGLNKRLKDKGAKIKGVLTDVSEPAVSLAKQNYQRLLPKDKSLKIYQSDLMNSIPTKIKFDLILANLPYIPSSRVPRLPESVIGYEPHLALDGGPEGFSLIKKLLVQAKDRLDNNGRLIQEIDYSHDISDFVEILGYEYEIICDDNGQNRFLLARKKF